MWISHPTLNISLPPSSVPLSSVPGVSTAFVISAFNEHGIILKVLLYFKLFGLLVVLNLLTLSQLKHFQIYSSFFFCSDADTLKPIRLGGTEIHGMVV